MSVAYLSMGSNLGNRAGFLKAAIARLDAMSEVRIEAVSPIYETEPVGYTAQPDFLNLAVRIRTDLSPEQLLERLQVIELELGRKRERRFGPRTIDIDILLFENEVRTDAHLTLPHPRMHERAFVLIPLRDIMPGLDAKIPERPGVRLAGRIDDGPSVVFSKDTDRLETSPVEDIEKTDIM